MKEFVNKILGSKDQNQTLLEQEHDMETSDLFVEDRNGETKYNKEVLINHELKKNALNWAELNRNGQGKIDRLQSQFQEHIQIAGNRMEIDWNGAQDIYQEVVGQDEDVEYLSEEQAAQDTAQSAYEATAAFEGAVRESLHSGMDQVVYETENNKGETVRTPVQPTVPETMYAFTEKADEEEMPEGWSIGHATAVTDRYHIKEELKQQLKHESGSTTEALIERANEGEDIEDPLQEVTGTDEYAQHKLEEYGFPEDEVEAEYAFAR